MLDFIKMKRQEAGVTHMGAEHAEVLMDIEGSGGRINKVER